MCRFLVGSDSSDSDDARRVVRSAKDRRGEELKATCDEIRVGGWWCNAGMLLRRRHACLTSILFDHQLKSVENMKARSNVVVYVLFAKSVQVLQPPRSCHPILKYSCSR